MKTKVFTIKLIEFSCKFICNMVYLQLCFSHQPGVPIISQILDGANLALVHWIVSGGKILPGKKMFFVHQIDWDFSVKLPLNQSDAKKYEYCWDEFTGVSSHAKLCE